MFRKYPSFPHLWMDGWMRTLVCGYDRSPAKAPLYVVVWGVEQTAAGQHRAKPSRPRPADRSSMAKLLFVTHFNQVNPSWSQTQLNKETFDRSSKPWSSQCGFHWQSWCSIIGLKQDAGVSFLVCTNSNCGLKATLQTLPVQSLNFSGVVYTCAVKLIVLVV